MDKMQFDQLRNELSVKAKNGLDFIISASIIWLAISYIWTMSYTAYDKSIMTFIVGSLMLPLTLLLSKIIKTTWVIKDNPLDPLGLWLNFAQLFYFPFLIFVLLKIPEYFVMTYVIITGAHFFPYGWFYKTLAFSIMAGVISFGALYLGLTLKPENTYLIALFMSGCLIILGFFLWMDYRNKSLKN